MSHYFSFLQFSGNKFSVWWWNCILRVQRKSLTSFFGFFADTSRILRNRFWKRMPEQDFMLSVIPFAKKDKKLQFMTSHWVSRTIFRKGWQNHFPFVQGHFLETKCFLQKTYTMKFLNFSSKKLPNLRKKIPQCWRNCFWWARRNHVEKINSSKENCLHTNLLPTSRWKFTAVFPRLLFVYSRIHFG